MWLDAPLKEERNLLVALKIAEVCNISCKYCYFFEHNDKSYEKDPPFISQNLVRDAGKFLGEGAAALGIPTVTIALHGGEPLMVGKKRMAQICEDLIREITPHAKLQLGVQTNGLLLDRQWVDIFSLFDCSIGLSLDGPRHIHDAMRVDRRGNGSFDRTMAALSLLKECVEDRVIPSVNILTVIGKDLSPRESYDFFVREHGVRNIFFKSPNFHWEFGDKNEVDHVTDFMKEIFEIWLSEDDPTVRIRTNIEVFRPFLHDRMAQFRVTHLIDLAQAICIRSNGDVCPDDSLPPISPRYRELGFNVQQHSLVDFYGCDIWREIQDSLRNPSEHCMECQWFGLCGGGPTVTRFSDDQLFRGPSVYCDAYRWLYAKAFDYMQASISKGELEGRVRMASDLLLNASLGEGAVR